MWGPFPLPPKKTRLKRTGGLAQIVETGRLEVLGCIPGTHAPHSHPAPPGVAEYLMHQECQRAQSTCAYSPHNKLYIVNYTSYV